MALISLQTVSQTASSLLALFSKEIKSLNGNDFRFKLRQARKARLIDVGSSEEHRELHIPGSEHYDANNPDFLQKLEYMDRYRPYFIYCRDGERSNGIAQRMEELGFKRVYSLLSGLQSWKGTVERSY